MKILGTSWRLDNPALWWQSVGEGGEAMGTAPASICNGWEQRLQSISAKRIWTFVPIRHGRAAFEHAGKTEVGQIEVIDPPDWENSGAVPKVLVVQRQ